jgi:hypothetical protein
MNYVTENVEVNDFTLNAYNLHLFRYVAKFGSVPGTTEFSLG